MRADVGHVRALASPYKTRSVVFPHGPPLFRGRRVCPTVGGLQWLCSCQVVGLSRGGVTTPAASYWLGTTLTRRCLQEVLPHTSHSSFSFAERTRASASAGVASRCFFYVRPVWRSSGEATVYWFCVGPFSRTCTSASGKEVSHTIHRETCVSASAKQASHRVGFLM